MLRDFYLYKNGVSFFMPRNQLTKDEIQCWVLKCKEDLYREQLTQYTTDPKQIAHKYLNQVLDKINQFRY